MLKFAYFCFQIIIIIIIIIIIENFNIINIIL